MNEISAWIDRFGKSDYQATVDTDVQGPDPNRFFLISFAYHASQGDYKNKTLIDLGNAADSTLQFAKRKSLYGQLQRLALQDLPVLPLYRAPILSLERSAVNGYVVNGKGFSYFDRVTLAS